MSSPSPSTASTPDPGMEYLKTLYRYGMLAVLLGLLAFNIHVSLRWENSTGIQYNNLLVNGMLLLNHFAFSFRWSKPVATCLRIAAYVVGILGLLYLMYFFRR